MDENRPPSFQFYPADWLSSAAVARMSLEARGAYINLLCHAWLQPDCGILPNDDEVLAALSGAGERWPSVSHSVRLAFAERGNLLVQSRMCRERAVQLRRYERARLGAEITNEKLRQRVLTLSDSTAIRSATALSSSSSSSSSKKQKEESLESKTESEPAYSENGLKAKEMIQDLAKHLEAK